MPDLVFTTRGQAEALAAQESLRKAALDLKAEFEAGAKATGAWDASLAKLKSAGEGALRSIQTEQEKIVDKIAKIEQAQKKGLIPPEEAEQGIKRLRQQWAEADEATIKHRENLAAVAAENDKIKTAAEGALRSVQTEQEKLLVQIDKIGEAQKRGLVPPSEAQEAIRRLRERWTDLDEATQKQKEQLQQVTAEHNRLRSAAEGALRSIRTEEEKLLETIHEIERAMEAGLVPPAEAEQAISRYREQLEEVRSQTDDAVDSTSRLQSLVGKAFDPTTIVKWGLSFVGVKAMIGGIRREIEDVQAAIDRRAAAHLGPEEERKTLEADAARARDEAALARRRQAEAGAKFRADFAAGGDWGPANPLWSVVQEAEAAAAAADQRAAEAEQALAAFAASPRARRSDRARQVNDLLDQTYNDLAAEGAEDFLSTDQLRKLEDILREAGQGATSRKFGALAALVGAGDAAVSRDEAAAMLRDAAETRRTANARGLQFAAVLGGRVDFPADPLSRQDQAAIQLLQKMADSLESLAAASRDGGLLISGE